MLSPEQMIMVHYAYIQTVMCFDYFSLLLSSLLMLEPLAHQLIKQLFH